MNCSRKNRIETRITKNEESARRGPQVKVPYVFEGLLTASEFYFAGVRLNCQTKEI